MRRIILALVALGIAASIADAQTFEYRNKDGSTGTMTITRDSLSGRVLIANPKDSISCGADWATLSDRRIDKEGGTAVKFVAALKGDEDFSTPAGDFKAHRYSVSVSGVPALLWSVSVWIRASDGANLSYNKESMLLSVSQ